MKLEIKLVREGFFELIRALEVARKLCVENRYWVTKYAEYNVFPHPNQRKLWRLGTVIQSLIHTCCRVNRSDPFDQEFIEINGYINIARRNRIRRERKCRAEEMRNHEELMKTIQGDYYVDYWGIGWMHEGRWGQKNPVVEWD